MSARRRRSRKRSAASLGSTRRKSRRSEPTFLVDECLGKSLAPKLRGAGAIARWMPELCGPGADDVVWLRTAKGIRKAVVLTKDSRIRKRPLELEALRKVGRSFVLVAANLPTDAQADAIVKALPAMRRICVRHKPPFVGRITQNGHVELI